ncbi:MAG TPA: hypothetical protein VH639_29645 [Bryobacteraceae bacterium]|jgi:hypothetical protein
MQPRSRGPAWVEVWVEQLDPRVGEDFGWLRLESATVTPGPALAPGADPTEVLWSGQITVPEAATGGWPYRVVVAEYEEYMVDDGMPYQQPSTRKDRRQVFVDTAGSRCRRRTTDPNDGRR